METLNISEKKNNLNWDYDAEADVLLLGVNDDKTIEGIKADVTGSLVKNLANLSNNPQKLFPSFLLESQVIDYNGKLLIEEDVFKVKVPLVNDVTDNVTKDVTKDVTKEDRKEAIIEMISKEPEITINDIAELLNITSRTVLREFKKLMAQKRITRKGGRKNGSWQIVEDKKG